MDCRIADELTRLIQRDLAQIAYRTVCVDGRQSALGSPPGIGQDPADSHAYALRVARGEFSRLALELLL